jgi:hypothetical protein
MDITICYYSIVFKRLEPFNDLKMKTLFDLLVSGSIGSSFHCNHIADYFALTTFFTSHFIPFTWRFLWYIWAFFFKVLVYKSVHGLLDVFINGFIGFNFGNIVAKTYLRFVNNKTK